MDHFDPNRLRNIWISDFTTRLDEWRSLREHASNIEDTFARATLVFNWWGTAPRSTISMDVFSPNSWPTPWEMLSNNDYCNSSVALGMAYTMNLCNESDSIQLKTINDINGAGYYLATIVNGTIIMNYQAYKIVGIDDIIEKDLNDKIVSTNEITDVLRAIENR